jgi:2,3-bisphosphoglycerate-independent phosphoglycerate mutase
MPKPIVVLIRDGWGYRKEKTDNAIEQGNTPFTHALMRDYPNTLLAASGTAVGLPNGFQGNSEVGHMTIGSGRIPKQAMVRIDESITNGCFEKNQAIAKALDNCVMHGTSMHLIGLVQTEGVHAKMEHLFAILAACKKKKVNNVFVHIITDGRDAPPTAGKAKIEEVEKYLKKLGIGRIATIGGRYYAMDRDQRWDRIKKAYDAIVLGRAEPILPLDELYSKKETDEFLVPRKAPGYIGFKDNDSVIFYNFRTDRTRQLTQAIVEEKFDGFVRTKIPLCYVAMTQFYRPMNAFVAFEEISFENILGCVLADHNLRQLRISETEKYAHVTFFFNCQNETPFRGEDRILIPSPKVATYDLLPEMSADQITSRLLQEMDKDIYDVIITNIVNGDMVGHTGVISACLKAVEVVDRCIHLIIDKTLEKEGIALVFADHGNIEDQTPQYLTSHTLNPVPFLVISKKGYILRKGGGLSDVAPTILDLLSIPKPKEMTGESLILK